ncbi:hypothetical protein GS421_06645 [Rhodococcus hoagii]|nr:hypothetical protein [Prescottella equi]
MISAEAAGALAVLALTDSLSFGTLLVPVWLLMTPGRVRPHRILLYLGTVAAVYYGIGIALMAGGRFVIDSAAGLLDTTAATAARLVVGAALLAASFALDTKAARARAAERAQQSGRLNRWRERAMSDSSTSTLVGLAVAAVALEVASMLPYLVATGTIADQTPGWSTSLAGVGGVLPGDGRTCAGAHRWTARGPLRRRGTTETTRHVADTHVLRTRRLWIIVSPDSFPRRHRASDLGWVPR